MNRQALLLLSLTTIAGLAGYTLVRLLPRSRGSYEVSYSNGRATATLHATSAGDAVRRMAEAVRNDIPYTL